MKITILCSDATHPVNIWLEDWAAQIANAANVEIVRKVQDAGGGDILFLISCTEVVTREERNRYGASLVLHASALPKGRGWSPHIWELIEGAENITLSLLEAEDSVDSGRVWTQRSIPIPRHALWSEINEALFSAEIALMTFALENFRKISLFEQSAEGVSYHRRRTPSDSEIDPNRTIAEQFDLIRVCDPQRFPAYFHLRGHRYVLKLEKYDGQ
ncbi:MAG TPA: formyltransferase family protein [Croceibacterium sp.]|nr:formyltransferase family protein [Croceibacterium sp.]